MVIIVGGTRLIVGALWAAALAGCSGLSISETGNAQGPNTAAPSLEVSVAADGTVSTLGLSFMLPDGFEITESLEPEWFSAGRLDSDVAGLFIWPCPHCSERTMEDEQTEPTAIEIDGYSALVVETTNGLSSHRLLILADDRSVMARMLGTDIDDAWQEFLDSVRVTL